MHCTAALHKMLRTTVQKYALHAWTLACFASMHDSTCFTKANNKCLTKRHVTMSLGKTLRKRQHRTLMEWCKFNGVPSIPKASIHDLASTLWTSHLSHLTHHITRTSIDKLAQLFPGAVFHCEDKHASSLRIFCPCLYFQAIDNTFMDPAVFNSVSQSPQYITSVLIDQLLQQYGKSYPWAIGKGRQLPSGYILAKKKKAFTSGRPIISFVDAPFRPMLNILAKLIFQLIPLACPDHFATGDVYHLLTILRQAPAHRPLSLYNQDLAGFFTSIDQQRFLGAWYMLLDFLRPHMDVRDTEVFSVYPGRSNNPGELIKGRAFRRLNVTRKILIRDVPSLLLTALNMQTFCLGQRCVSQLRGSPMGSPLSPALCLMVVSISEQIWTNCYRSVLTNHHLFIQHIRYVDNRLILGEPHLSELHPYEVLLDSGFYGKPFVLETEPDQEFLGFMLETDPLELIYVGPTNCSQVLSPFSASPPKVLLSGFRSRCHIVVKGAFPDIRVHQGLKQLVELYCQAGFDRDEFTSISSKILTTSATESKKRRRIECGFSPLHSGVPLFHSSLRPLVFPQPFCLKSSPLIGSPFVTASLPWIRLNHPCCSISLVLSCTSITWHPSFLL